MKTFDECQAFANRVPRSLRNNRVRTQLPALGFREEAVKIGILHLTEDCRKSGRDAALRRPRPYSGRNEISKNERFFPTGCAAERCADSAARYPYLLPPASVKDIIPVKIG
jgi:hypothetical protein